MGHPARYTGFKAEELEQFLGRFFHPLSSCPQWDLCTSSVCHGLLSAIGGHLHQGMVLYLIRPSPVSCLCCESRQRDPRGRDTPWTRSWVFPALLVLYICKMANSEQSPHNLPGKIPQSVLHARWLGHLEFTSVKKETLPRETAWTKSVPMMPSQIAASSVRFLPFQLHC